MRVVIAVVVVTFSASVDDLDRAIAAIRAAGGADHVIVVDTGGHASPTDIAVETVATDNRGYGAAANAGVEHARAHGATAVALLNDDVVVHPGWLQPLAAELGGDVGAVQPKLLFSGSAPPRVNSLGVRLDEFGAGTDIGDGELDEPGGAPRDIELFTGGAVLCSLAFLDDVGGFDERYFLYYEDIDLGRRGHARGWRYRCVPTSVVEHVRGAATSAMPDRTRYLQERNRLWCAARFEPPATVVRAIWLSIRRLRHPPRGVHVRALAAGLAGMPTRLVERARSARSVTRSTPPDSW